jgi:hypothetical protein
MSRNKFLNAKFVTLNIFQKWGTTNIRHSLAKFFKLCATKRIYNTAVAWLSCCFYAVLAVVACRGWSVDRQSKRLTLVQNNNMPTCILVRGLCENCTASVWNTGTIKDKGLHIAKHLKPHTEFWVLPTANAELQRPTEADVLATTPRCTNTSTRRIDSMTTAEHT